MKDAPELEGLRVEIMKRLELSLVPAKQSALPASWHLRSAANSVLDAILEEDTFILFADVIGKVYTKFRFDDEIDPSDFGALCLETMFWEQLSNDLKGA